MEETKQGLDRRSFMGVATAMAAVSVGAALPVKTATAAHHRTTDFTRWLDSIPGTYRQVTDWPDLNIGMGLAYTYSYLITAPEAYNVDESEIGAALIIRHDTIPIALKDPVWAKYNLGELFRIKDPDTDAPALRNPYYVKPGALPFPDAALQRLMERGVKVAACDLALTFWSSVVAEKMGLTHEEVKGDWVAAVHPGIQVVPSGTVACHGAAARGCSYLFAG